jgi:hypothetical protein
MERFENFRDWAIAQGWHQGVSIERRDNNGDYCPENCRVATTHEQANNKRSNSLFTAWGETKTASEWSRDPRCTCSYVRLIERVTKQGWTAEAAISTPTRAVNRVAGTEVGQAATIDYFSYPHRSITRHPLYHPYKGMHIRCYWSKAKEVVRNYQERGITVCDEWRNNFRAFFNWAVASGWQPGLTLDRIDNDQGYSPNNCRWIPFSAQNRNRRSNCQITAFGETKVLNDWVKDPRCRIGLDGLRRRIQGGWNPEDALSTPQQPTHPKDRRRKGR